MTSEKSKLNHVVVGVDRSPGARLAVSRSLRLPLAPGARVTIVHVAPSGWKRFAAADVEELAGAIVHEAVSAARDEAQTAGAEVSIHGEVRHGNLTSELIAIAEQGRAELIVVGRHGEGSFTDLVIGSTAERLMRESVLPVLIVQQAVTGPYRRLLVGTDFDGSEQRAIEAAVLIMEPPVESLHLIHAINDADLGIAYPYEGLPVPLPGDVAALRESDRASAELKMKELVERYQRFGATVETEIIFSDPRTALVTASQKKGAELLCLGTHQRQGLVRLAVGSVAEGVSRHAGCDVLIAAPEVGDGGRETREATATG
jgi:nucleotide-binding universal stress UspA family protein